jgi:prephenate dehydrogenase
MPLGSPPFGRIAIAGVGLIGGSLAGALRQIWPSIEILALDRPEVLADATARRLIDRPARTIVELSDADLIVLALPVPEILKILPAIAALPTTPVVTDVGSTKRRICQVAADAGLARFVGGHPVAGSERPGLTSARPDLFDGQPWLLINTPSSPDDPVARVEKLVRSIGAVPHRIDAETHDRTMAYVSHLPQLLAVALINTAGAAIGESGLRFSGRAFGEMTRLAASPAELWEGILATNADYVADAAAAIAAELPSQAARLEMTRWIDETFHRAGEWRERLSHARAAEPR